MPSKNLLTPAASGRFREQLRRLKKRSDMSGADLAKILGCCRKTVWALLKEDDKRQVRYLYANRLSAHMNLTAAKCCLESPKTKHGISGILVDWQRAREPRHRRAQAYRLSNFIVELATTSFELLSNSTLSISLDGEPTLLELELYPPRTNARTIITLHLKVESRKNIPMVYTVAKGQVIYRGELSQVALNRLLKKSASAAAIC